MKKERNEEQHALRASLHKLESALVRLDAVREAIRAVIPTDGERAELFQAEGCQKRQSLRPREVH